MSINNRLNKISINFFLWGLMALWFFSVVPMVSAQTYDFDEGLEALTKGLVLENREILEKKKTAVFGIIESKSGNKWEVSSHIEDGIVDALVNNGYRVIERRRIQDVIQKEIKKSTDLWFNQTRVAQFGKLVGADFVVTGSYVLWGQGTLKISIRAINVADGEILAANKVRVHTDRIANLLKSIEQKKSVKAIKLGPEKLVKVKRIDELTHESGKMGKYKALIIGINDYQAQNIPDLETATNDATAMARVLKEKYGFEVKLLLDREATKDIIYRELRNLTVSTKSDDSVLIYFAGHGDLDRAYDGGWWIPADAIGGNPVTYLDNIQVQKAMRNMKARHVLLVSDACYSGTLFGKARSLPAVIDDKYYLSLYNEKSRWGMTSGNKTPVSDQGTGGHSMFAYQLIEELGKNDKPFLSIHELYSRIAPVITNNSEQTPICRPIVNTGDRGGEFVFVASAKKERAPIPTIPNTLQNTLRKDEDMLFWQSVRNSNDPALFEAYLKAFPTGIFAFIAKRKIETFKQNEEIAAVSPAKPVAPQDNVNLHKQKKEDIPTPPPVLKSKLFVELEPTNAKVRILNIGPKFHQGIALNPGRYHTEVSSNGYKTQKIWVKLEPGKDTTLRFSLERKSRPKIDTTTVHQSPLDKDMLFWQSIKDSNDPALFEAYLKKFPNGIFAFIAKRKIETFKQNEEIAAVSPAKPVAPRDNVNLLKRKKENVFTSPPDLKSKLFVEVEPTNARVRILNIGLKFSQGMALNPGRYHTEVSSNGYKTQKIWVKLEPGRETTLRFNLERKSRPQVKAPTKQTLKHSTPIIPSSDKYQRDNRHEDAQPPVQKQHENGQIIEQNENGKGRDYPDALGIDGGA